MSGVELNQPKPAVTPGRRGGGGQALLALILAGLAAATAVALALSLRADLSTATLAGLGALAFVGLLGLLLAVAGMVRLGRKRTQAGLGAHAFDALADACLITDKRDRPVCANAAYRAFSGMAESAAPQGLDKIYAGYPEISGAIYRLTRAAVDGKAHEENIRLMAGSAAVGARAEIHSWLKVAVTPFHDEAGALYALWRVRDVTEERSAQEEAFQQLQHIIDYLDNAPAGFFSADQDQRIQYVNATLADWLKIDLTKTTGGVLGLDDIATGDAMALMTGRKLTPGELHTHTLDIDLKTSEGSSFPVRVIQRVSTDGDGAPYAMRALVLTRVGDMAHARDDGEVELRFQRFFHNAPVAIAQVDAKGAIQEVNARFVTMFGTRVHDVGLPELVEEDARAPLMAALAAGAEAHADIEPVEITIHDPQSAGDSGGGLGDFSAQRTGKLYVSAPGSVEGSPALIVYAIETTEQKSLEAQFTQSQKMQAVGQLAGGVAHDFNNVLTAVIGFSDLLLARHRPTDPSFQDIMNIKQNANRAANLVRQLLAFSRRQTLRPKVLSLAEVMSDLGNLLGRLLGENVTLNTQHGRDLWPVKVDVNQFEQVIINLAVNARDAMADGGSLSVKTANIPDHEVAKLGHGVMPPGDYVLCEITDTGAGMTPEVLDKIYEPFFSTKDVGKGTGLGLSTVYGIVKQTGGFIFAESEPGRGTSFRIYLPRYYPTQDDVVEDAAAKPESKTDLTGEGTILLVEDEDAVRAFATRALTNRGYTVLAAANGLAAFDVIDGHDGEIDLIISDVVMPEMDGPTLLGKLRERGIGAKVIFISGYAEEAFKKNLGEDQAFTFLPKPFSLKELAQAVKDTLS